MAYHLAPHFHVILIINYITIIKKINNKLLLKLKDNWVNKIINPNMFLFPNLKKINEEKISE